MNFTLTTLNQPAAPAKAAAPAANDATTPPTADVAAAPAAAQGEAAPAAQAQPALAFAQWLGLEQVAPVAVDAAAVTPDTAAPESEVAADEQQAADTPLLGAMAMSMPLLPQIQIGQATLAAMSAALPGVPAAKEAAPAADTDFSLPGATAPARREGRVELAAVPVAAPALPMAEAPVEAAHGAAAKAGPAAAPTEALASNGDAQQDQAAPATERSVTAGVAPAPGATPRTADTVTLSGPPTAWRQTLQEALGERMQLQVGKNAEQAVIRLEPPMLGRVEIAIRHSAGSLEVHITATHGEVLRQLQSVSEGLRNDLAQRQFSDVSVNIAPAPRAANGAPMFAGGEGRGRQQDGRQPEQGPGEALAEANLGTSPFSLNGRS